MNKIIAAINVHDSQIPEGWIKKTKPMVLERIREAITEDDL